MGSAIMTHTCQQKTYNVHKKQLHVSLVCLQYSWGNPPIYVLSIIVCAFCSERLCSSLTQDSIRLSDHDVSPCFLITVDPNLEINAFLT